ncbi:branched-chain amino acid transport system permease protein [Ardenticatena maritima]|uniref:Branched-chain amino acid transport system permease protein n=1 Tax=Ardenticatena maritima TaxID=872965 RepID=A0A0M9UD50_9CHLR|nr:branched-chain amino acid ABC transporter permease [Ardenticatena maritima]GAP63664.1 branched-chain amino acid transport system permease protein [Ardenticatena maritima]
MTIKASRRARTMPDFTTLILWGLGGISLLVILYRIFVVLTTQEELTATIWGFQLVNGLVLGGVYALIALGYTLVYGILFMINFAHGEVMMLGAYAGYFTLTFLNARGFMETNPILTLVITFIAGMLVSMLAGITLERVAYRPLRRAPRLVPLITAIGASIFLQNAALRIFGSKLRVYVKPSVIEGGFRLGESGIFVPRTGVLIFVTSILLMIGLYLLVQYTKLGKAMRAVAEDKDTAALMGIDVDRVIVQTFMLGSLLAGAAGVMLGFHNSQVNAFIGFIPGIKAFTAAVLGGIGNIPGAMFGGFFLGLAESLGPTALGIPSQYKDVIAFSLLVLVLIFRPTGLLGEVLSEKRA